MEKLSHLIKALFYLVAQMVKNLPAMWETWVRSLGWEDPLEKGMVTHSRILASRIPWGEALTGYSPWGGKESDTTERLSLHFTSPFHPISPPGKLTKDLIPRQVPLICIFLEGI